MNINKILVAMHSSSSSSNASDRSTLCGKMQGLIEQGLTSHQTHYRSYREQKMQGLNLQQQHLLSV